MAGFWGRRKREDAEIEAQDAELSRKAGAALVSADERIRVTDDELSYAEIELGRDATAPLREALAAVRQHLGEAFQLHQLNHDEIPDTAEELFATPLDHPGQAQRLLDAEGGCLILPDAHKVLIET